MTFSGVNYLAIIIAAVVAWLAGAVWYMALGRTWMAALGVTAEQMEARKRAPGAYLPFIYAFAVELVMAWTLAGILGHLEVCDRVVITAMSLVTHSIREPGEYSSGTPLMDNRAWRKSAARFKQLDAMARRSPAGASDKDPE